MYSNREDELRALTYLQAALEDGDAETAYRVADDALTGPLRRRIFDAVEQRRTEFFPGLARDVAEWAAEL